MQRASAAIIGIAILVAAVVIGFLLLAGPPREPSASASAQASGSAAAEPSQSVAAELRDRRWTLLYVGTDANERRQSEGEAINTDALMLVSLSADQTQLTLVSLPRDTVDVPLEDGETYEGKINSLARERGTDVLVRAMETVYGVPIDAHVALDMDDFARLVEAAGGVEVSPETALTDPIVNLDLDAGPQHLDASQALGYVRTRVDKDYGRMARQQEVIVELVERLVDPQAEVELGPLIEGLQSLETDLPLDQLSALIELARRAGDAEVTELVIGPPLITFEGDRDDGRGYVLEADFDAIRAEVQRLLGE